VDDAPQPTDTTPPVVTALPTQFAVGSSDGTAELRHVTTGRLTGATIPDGVDDSWLAGDAVVTLDRDGLDCQVTVTRGATTSTHALPCATLGGDTTVTGSLLVFTSTYMAAIDLAHPTAAVNTLCGTNTPCTPRKTWVGAGLVVRLEKGRLTATDPTTGQRVWDAPAPQGGHRSVTFTGGRVVIASEWDGSLFGPVLASGYCRYTVLDARTGRRVASAVSDGTLLTDVVFDDHWMLVGHPLDVGFNGDRPARVTAF
jgi:outer membrane protein assembly factor BamB